MSGERIGVLETKMPEPQAGRRDDPNPGKRHAHEIVVEQRGLERRNIRDFANPRKNLSHGDGMIDVRGRICILSSLLTVLP